MKDIANVTLISQFSIHGLTGRVRRQALHKCRVQHMHTSSHTVKAAGMSHACKVRAMFKSPEGQRNGIMSRYITYDTLSCP